MKNEDKNEKDAEDDKHATGERKKKPVNKVHETELSKKEAEAGAPADSSVAGEEDPGVALEFLVDKKKN